MDNLNDIYYIVRLLVRQIFIYLRDFFLRDSPWLSVSSNDFEATIAKQSPADFLAVSVVCVLFLLLIVLSSMCVKDDQPDYISTNVGTIIDIHEEHSCISRTESSSSCNRDPASGDCIASSKDTVRKRSTDSMFSARRSSRDGNASRKSVQLPVASDEQTLYTQCTQTSEKLLKKRPQDWLIRRTRSGQVYGKYPL